MHTNKCPHCNQTLQSIHLPDIGLGDSYIVDCPNCDYSFDGDADIDIINSFGLTIRSYKDWRMERYLEEVARKANGKTKRRKRKEPVLKIFSQPFKLVEFKEDPTFLVVDLFCGAGGTTTGFMLTGRISKVIACINHDFMAITSHWANHPDVHHFEEDIRILPMGPLKALVRMYRERYPNAKLILWASLECTNFSKAKGGQSRDADSRTLANHLLRYINALQPDYIQIENVVEFMAWGPLKIKVKKKHKDHWELKTQKDRTTGGWQYAWEPESSKNGRDWLRWRESINALGYRDQWKEMNAADYGAYTSRNRLFGIFAKGNLPIVWPEATHEKVNKKATGKTVAPDLFGIMRQPWKPVKEVLDFSDEGYSIFYRNENMGIPARNRRKISPKTYERIYQGLVKQVAGGEDSFITKHFSGKPEYKNISVNGPAGTITTSANQSLIKAKFIVQRNGGDAKNRIVDVDGPARTLTATGGNQDLVNVAFITKWNSNNPVTGANNGNSIDEPCPTVTTQNRLGMVKAVLMPYYSSGGTDASIDGPCPTLRTKDTVAFIAPEYLQGLLNTSFIEKRFGGVENHQSIDQPAGSIMGNDKNSLVTVIPFIDRPFSEGGGKSSSVEVPAGSILSVPKLNLVTAIKAPFIMPTQYNNSSVSIEHPCPVVTASRRHHLLINPSWGGHTMGVDQPSPVIIARGDKAPLYLVAAEVSDDEALVIPVYEDDCEAVVKIKMFMVRYGIVDIKMRMLKVSELLKIQGFPKGYKLKGSQTEQKKFIGNSVEPKPVMHWAIELANSLKQKIAA